MPKTSSVTKGLLTLIPAVYKRNKGYKGEFVLDDAPAIKDEALKRSLLGRRYMLLMNPA
jgi:hypothetical protein